jgi:hypothetical protein
MQIPLLHQQILLQTERLRELHRSIMQHAPPVQATEIENLLKEIRALYATVLELNNENAIQLLNEIQLAANQIVPEKSPASNGAVTTDKSLAGHAGPVSGSTAREYAAEVHEAVIPPVTPEKKQLAADHLTRFPEVATFARRFEDRPTLGEKMAVTESRKRVSDTVRTPVSDLKSVIGLNEKFQFINQLFKGDAVRYNEMVDKINASASIDAAMDYVKELSELNDWESHASSAKTFIDMVERRFLT